MNILVVSYGCPSKKYPQNGIFQMDQAKALSDCGHKVVFAAIDARSVLKWRRWGLVERKYNGLTVIEFNYPMGPIMANIRLRFSRIGFGILLRRVIKKIGKPDIVHVHFGETANVVVEKCKYQNIPYVITEHSSSINRDDLTEKEIAPYRYVYQNAAAVIAVSNELANRILRYSGVNPIVIPNIVDLSVFSYRSLPHEGFRFISAGYLRKEKGFDVLLDAFKQATDRGLDAKLLIMGDGLERESLKAIIEELKINDQVTLFGAYTRAQFAEELAKSDAFVLSSRGETFGVVYIEAMASGLPVIATRCGGPEDFVNANNGVLVSIDNVEELTDALLQMRCNKSYNADAINTYVTNIFSAKSVASKIEKVLESVISK